LAWRWDEDKKGKEQVVLGGVVAMVRRGHAMCVISLSRGKTTRETTNEGVRAEGVWAGKEKERWAGLGLKGKERKNWARGEREAQGREEGFSFLFLFKTV
jgi:hypothetical protein